MTKIAQLTQVAPEKVVEVVRLALEELHRITIVDEKGTTAAVMEACFSFGDKAAFHLIGLFPSTITTAGMTKQEFGSRSRSVSSPMHIARGVSGLRLGLPRKRLID